MLPRHRGQPGGVAGGTSGINLGIAMAIATIKASLVILYFMHVRWSTHLTWVVVIGSFLWLGVLFVLGVVEWELLLNWSGSPWRENRATLIDDLSAGKREYVPESVTFHDTDIRDTKQLTKDIAGADVIVHGHTHLPTPAVLKQVGDTLRLRVLRDGTERTDEGGERRDRLGCRLAVGRRIQSPCCPGEALQKRSVDHKRRLKRDYPCMSSEKVWKRASRGYHPYCSRKSVPHFHSMKLSRRFYPTE